MRTKDNYDVSAREAKLTNGQSTPLTGIKFNCHMNKSFFFHVANNLILDCMHDFLEGIVPFMIMLVFRQFSIDGKYCFLAGELNKRLIRFSYSYYDKKNKPSPKFNDFLIRKRGNYSTKQRASQNWCLIRMIPLIIGDLIEVADPYFELILMLNRIMDIVFAPSIALEHTVILEDLNNQIFLF